MERTVRRLAAVLAADLGYSIKIEADESATLAALRDVAGPALRLPSARE
jgi:hypothetical protein